MRSQNAKSKGRQGGRKRGGGLKLTPAQWRLVWKWQDAIPHKGARWPRGTTAALLQRIRDEFGAHYTSTGLILALRRRGGYRSSGPRLPGEDPFRDELLALVRERPGMHFREISRRASASHVTVHTRLRELKREGLLQIRANGRAIAYFPAGGVPSRWKGERLLDKPELRQLHEWLRARPSPPNQLAILDQAQRWGWARSTAQHRLKRLVAAGLVHARRSHRNIHYRADGA